jgi:hypothetical protein
VQWQRDSSQWQPNNTTTETQEKIMTLQTNVTLLDTVFLQEVDDEIILLETESEEYFSLNETGGIFYDVLKDETNLGKVMEELKECFEISEEQLQKDLFAFVEALEQKGLVFLS